MPRSASASPSVPALAIDGDAGHLRIEGELRIPTLEQARQSLAQWLKQGHTGTLDLARLQGLDTPGALLLCELRHKGIGFTGVRPDHAALLELVCGLDLKPLPALRKPARWRQLVMQLGKGAEDAWRATVDLLTFMGRISSVARHVLRHPSAFRPAAISRHVAQTGIEALPIVGLMAVLISVVIGYQGVAQLRPYGGEDFTINLVAVSVLREMGVLITAIMVAGRSGSAFTAEIGVMAVMISVVIGYQGVAQLRPYGGEDFTINLVAVSVLREMGVLITAIMVAGRTGAAFTAEIGVMMAREEVDALKVMGVEPMAVLVVPRVIGLMITLPLLAFFADMMGLLGGAGIAQAQLGVSPVQYVDRVHHAVDVSDFLVGIVKAPVFAFLIAVIGCMHGLRVRGSAESVGKETTRSVVKAIFLVIVLDALFSVFFEKLGW